MGNSIPVCVNYVSPVNELGLYGWSLTTACDEWTSPHILSPFLISIITFWPYFAFHVCGYWEAIEVFFVWVSGGYLIFINNIASVDPNVLSDDETFVMTFIEDWFIQGGIGTLIIGNLFLIWLKPPVLLNFRDVYRKPKYFWFYAVMLGLYYVPYIAFSYVDLTSGVKVGQIIVICWQPLWVFLMCWLEGWWMSSSAFRKDGSKILIRGKWKGRLNSSRIKFWCSFLVIALLFMIQNYFNWFISGGVQSWIVAFIVISALILLMVYDRETYRKTSGTKSNK